jgi:hypothetical protein
MHPLCCSTRLETCTAESIACGDHRRSSTGRPWIRSRHLGRFAEPTQALPPSRRCGGVGRSSRVGCARRTPAAASSSSAVRSQKLQPCSAALATQEKASCRPLRPRRCPGVSSPRCRHIGTSNGILVRWRVVRRGGFAGHGGRSGRLGGGRVAVTPLRRWIVGMARPSPRVGGLVRAGVECLRCRFEIVVARWPR